MKPWLYVGAKLVCVDAKPSNRTPGRRSSSELVEGQQYTVREVWLGIRCGEPSLGILVEEITSNIHCGTGHEYGFAAIRFRPLLPDTKPAVNEMRNLMLDATVRGKVDA